MALIIEDGTGKVDAQSYVSADEARTFALSRGVVLAPVPGVGQPDPVEAQLMNAMDYIESLESRFKGKRSFPDHPQALSWPRTGARIGCEHDEYPSDKVPANVASAQCQLVIAQFNGVILMPVVDPNKQLVKRKKVDVLETEYFGPQDVGAGFGASPSFPVVDALLRPLMRAGGSTTAPAYRWL